MDKDLYSYLKKLKVHDIKGNELLKRIGDIQEFWLYDDKMMQCCIQNDKNLFKSIPGMKVMRRKQNALAWFEKSNYLVKGIKYSLSQAIELIENNEEIFVPYRISEENEKEFYYIENAEYRLFSLCEVLAQVYNEFFEITDEIKNINHTRFLKNRKELIVKKIEGLNYGSEVNKKIMDELEEVILFFEINEPYKYLNEKRNSFTHRENPHSSTILNGKETNSLLVDHPLYEIKQIVEVLESVVLYICTIYKLYWFEFKSYGLFKEYKLTVIGK